MITKKKRLIAVLLISLILLTSGVTGFSIKGVGSWLGKNYLSDILKEPRILASNLKLLHYGRLGYKIIYDELLELITMNPPIKENFLLQTFMKIVIPFYILSIAGAGFYLLFYSGSPEKRARAKSMLGKMVIGLIIISVSPQLLETGLNLSQNLTHQILNTVEIDAFVDVIKEYIRDFSRTYTWIGQLDPSFGFIFPFLWIMYLVWGILAMIAMRYILLVLWIGLFPLTVFFYSFEMTRTLGKNMMEQTILWTVLQTFNASVVVGVVLARIPGTGCIPGPGLSCLPVEENIFIIGGFSNFMLFAGAAIFILAPLMMTRLFRNFLPG